MKITLILIGKTDESFIEHGFELYLERLRHYINVKVILVPAVKNAANLTSAQVKEHESSLLLRNVPIGSVVVLLDERGTDLRSVEFALQLQKWMNAGTKDLCFITGGAFGLSDTVKKQAHFNLSLSKMTFTHQMVRLIFAEQLYRAFSIIRNEPYHNE